MNPENSLGNLTCLPLCKRGIEGDFLCSRNAQIPPSPPFAKGGMRRHRGNDGVFGLMDNLE